MHAEPDANRRVKLTHTAVKPRRRSISSTTAHSGPQIVHLSLLCLPQFPLSSAHSLSLSAHLVSDPLSYRQLTASSHPDRYLHCAHPATERTPCVKRPCGKLSGRGSVRGGTPRPLLFLPYAPRISSAGAHHSAAAPNSYGSWRSFGTATPPLSRVWISSHSARLTSTKVAGGIVR